MIIIEIFFTHIIIHHFLLNIYSFLYHSFRSFFFQVTLPVSKSERNRATSAGKNVRPPPEIRSGARKCGASLINLVFIDNARHSVVHPLPLLPLDPCIRQRFTFLEVRGAAIITRRDLFKGWGAPDIGGIAEQRCPCTVYASTTSMWKLNNSRYRKAHSALFIPDNNELVRQREYLLSTTGFHLRVLSRAPRNPFPPLSFHSPFTLFPAIPPRRILLSLTRVYPSRQPSPPRPSLVPSPSPMSAIVSVYRVHIIVMTLRRYGDLRRETGRGGRGGAKNRGNLRSKLFASGPMRISERIIIIPGIHVLRAWTNECVSIW